MTLSAGVAQPPPTTAGPSFPRINGGRPRTNEYLFDGISVLQPEPGQIAFFPIVEAIQEFKVEVNSPPAEFGRFNGGVVNLTTKSGTNDFHGSAERFDIDDCHGQSGKRHRHEWKHDPGASGPDLSTFGSSPMRAI